MKRIVLSLAVFALFAIIGAGITASAQPADRAGIDEAVYTKLTTDLMCLCGCKTTLKDCPHTDCGYAIPAKNYIRAQLANGETPEAIKAAFVAQQGEEALSKPEMKGFNIVGYFLPAVALVLVAVAVVKLLSIWTKRGGETQIAAAEGADEHRSGDLDYTKKLDRLKQDLDRFDD
jgi:cytochrome c-type biogenesis protein CcmH/NrfF